MIDFYFLPRLANIVVYHPLNTTLLLRDLLSLNLLLLPFNCNQLAFIHLHFQHLAVRLSHSPPIQTSQSKLYKAH